MQRTRLRVQVATQLRSVVSLVSAGIGVSIVPLSAQQMNFENVAYKKLRRMTCHTELALVWRGHDASPVLEQFIGAARPTIHT